MKMSGIKVGAPFGQLPVLVIGKETLGQSLAIGRYLSRFPNLVQICILTLQGWSFRRSK